MTIPIRFAAAAVVAVLVVGGAFYLLQPDQPAVGGPSPVPTVQVPASSGVPSAAPTPQVPASSDATGGGSGSAHYEITGPDAASGDATFVRSTRDASSDSFSHTLVFQDGSLAIRIKLPAPGCRPTTANPLVCGVVDISNATMGLRDAGCTWDTASLTATGGTGTVECTNAVNPDHRETPNAVTITFTYHDSSG